MTNTELERYNLLLAVDYRAYNEESEYQLLATLYRRFVA